MAMDPNPNPSSTTSATAATTTRAFTNPASLPTTRPISPLSHPQQVYIAQPLPVSRTSPNPPPQSNNNNNSHQGILYPVASSGRGFISKPIHIQQTVTVANSAPYPPRPFLSYPIPHSPNPNPMQQHHHTHFMRPPHHHLQLPPHLASAASQPVNIKGAIPLSSALHSKVAPPSSVSDCNGYKDMRSRDDTLSVVKDRKVRITDGACLYALCRSWLRNGFPEESQPQNGDVVKSLPKPLPLPVVGTHLPKKKEGEEEEEEASDEQNEESVEHLLPQDLLKRHIKRAKKVRARLREERLQRIARYKSRLALLLPPLVEQFRNDSAARN